MKKKITLILLFTIASISSWAQTINFTAVPTSTTIGTILTIDYEYTIATAGQVTCGISLFDDWTYISYVNGASLNPAPAGTAVTGTFNILIPSGTAPTASLTGLQNYKIKLELLNESGTWLVGDYSVQNYNFTEATVLPSISVTSIPSSIQAGTNLVVNYKYTAAADGKATILVSKNGGTNAYDYISTVIYDQLEPAIAGTDVTGTFTVLIPNDTTPTSGLTGNENYRVILELKDANNNWLAGNYDNINYNITASLGTNDFNSNENKLAVYPNPIENILKIVNGDNLTDTSFRIINVSGQTVQNATNNNSNGIDVSGLKTGVYMLSVDSEKGNKQIKFIKK